MGKTSIEWTKRTWNPLAGCTAKSPGCLNCYAATMSSRLELMGQAKYTGVTIQKGKRKVFNGLIHYDEKALPAPLSIKKPDTFFVNSMSDLFWGDEDDLDTARRLGVIDPQPVPFEFIDKVFAVMALTPQHTYQILTKRPERMKAYFDNDETKYRIADAASALGHSVYELPRGPFDFGQCDDGKIDDVWAEYPFNNVWLGVSVEDQKTADERIPLLLETPAAVRWLSCEPLLGETDILKYVDCEMPCFCGDIACDHPGIDWVVIGGESGSHARPFDIDWARSLIEQCRTGPDDTPVFVKQLGSKPVDGTRMAFDEDKLPLTLTSRKGGDISEWPENLQIREFPTLAGEKVDAQAGK